MAPGPEFFQTIMGRKFFDGDLPRLIKALETIASKMTPSAPKLSSVPPPDLKEKVEKRIIAALNDEFDELHEEGFSATDIEERMQVTLSSLDVAAIIVRK